MTHACLTLWLLVSGGVSAPPVDPVVTVWYRGTPAGTPRQEELAVIRALGFNSITWPSAQASSLDKIKEMAASAGLRVLVADAPKPTTADTLLAGSERIDLVVTPQNAAALTPMAWRAVAHGTRILGFDSGSPSGAGMENPDRSLKPWVTAAQGVARQFSANNRLVQAFRAGPGLIMTPDTVPGLDVVLLDADRSWVLIATNTSNAAVAATVRLPTGTPYALWADILDNSSLAMAGELAGPRWNLKMDPHMARIYIIDKKMR